ncbi:DUF6214 family protein [Streptomyces sp. NPDC004629]|uniref:DUF6214 family protein n=1 Tax=Streptomyces sp. NPDC004629 TaxID=3364705 RepID=UPI00367AB1D5
MSVGPAWEVREGESAASWFTVRLAFADGARIDVLAVVCEGCVFFEDVRARPALSPDDLTVLADWIEEPLLQACGLGAEPGAEGGTAPAARARPAWPRGDEGRRQVARAYLAAQEEGADPVLAVMSATGYGRRKSLVLIAQARDAGLLPPRHARR